MSFFSLLNVEILAIFCLGISLRSIVSLYSYSGAGTKPMFGDYEAQRHWQEITINLDPRIWYKNDTNNDLLYWGLDYPPLTAYHSYLMGYVANIIDPSYVALQESRGYESAKHKSFMRLTVLLADCLLYLPSILFLCLSLDSSLKRNNIVPLFVLLLTYPGQILIDNGHFQYNNISLGLAALAIGAILRNRYKLAAFCFSLALNYKQMELYHALPIFSIMLAYCMSMKSFSSKFANFFALGSVVITTFAAIWSPWLNSVDNSLSVVKRLFPFGRGVFEDKVSNFWCTLNVVYKIKKHFTNENMATLCLTATTALILPINMCIYSNRSKKNFLFGLFNTAMIFFQFSFQVHEKSILLAVLPSFCLFCWQPKLAYWFLEVSSYSLFPLITKDKLTIPFFSLMCIAYLLKCICLKFVIKERKSSVLGFPIDKVNNVSLIFMLVMLVISLTVPTPKNYPDLWTLIISCTSCIQFLFFLLLGTYSQFFETTAVNN